MTPEQVNLIERMVENYPIGDKRFNALSALLADHRRLEFLSQPKYVTYSSLKMDGTCEILTRPRNLGRHKTFREAIDAARKEQA
jgi:hypothetical protein